MTAGVGVPAWAEDSAPAASAEPNPLWETSQPEAASGGEGLWQTDQPQQQSAETPGTQLWEVDPPAQPLQPEGGDPAEVTPQKSEELAPPADKVLTAVDEKGIDGIAFVGETNMRFVNNAELGRLLVLTGKLRNDYQQPRSFIQLKAQALAEGGRVLSECLAYAGNIVPEEDLPTVGQDILNMILEQKNVNQGLRANIAPEGEIEYMLVLPNVGNELTEYVVDLVGSEPEVVVEEEENQQ